MRAFARTAESSQRLAAAGRGLAKRLADVARILEFLLPGRIIDQFRVDASRYTQLT